jgi:hypothetical protein
MRKTIIAASIGDPTFYAARLDPYSFLKNFTNKLFTPR